MYSTSVHQYIASSTKVNSMGIFGKKQELSQEPETPVKEASVELPPETPDAEEEKPKKKYAKEKAPKTKNSEAQETETQINTRLNGLLYHVSNDSVDMYRQENNTSDLIGRLYYDEYDSDSISSPLSESITSSPLVSSPLVTGSGLVGEYFNLGDRHRSLSSNSLNTGFRQPERPGLPRIKSFERGISFDTSTNEHRKSLTLKLKHPQFKFRRNNKTFLAGFNNDIDSLKAIEWLFDEMIINGDTLIVLQVLDDKKYHNVDKRIMERALSKIENLNAHFKKIQVVFETVIGNPQKLLKKAIEEYGPAMMVVGTHHFDETQHKSSLWSKASILKHFLECALVPVIVVKPTYNYIEQLQKPVDSEDYFQNWIARTEMPLVLKKRRPRILSPSISPSRSRNNSSTNLSLRNSANNSSTNLSSLRNNTVSQAYSHQHIQLPKKKTEERGRQSDGEESDDGIRFFSPSRSRLPSRLKNRLSKIFH